MFRSQSSDDGQKTVTETCWVLIFNYAS